MRYSFLIAALALVWSACGSEPDVVAPEAVGDAVGGKRLTVSYPREWGAIDRATPELDGRFGPHDWTLCRGQEPCAAITFSPVDGAEADTRDTLTVLVTSNRNWRTSPEKEKWRKKWRWVDPLLGACLGDALNLALSTPGVTRRLIEHEDGFWWTYAFDGIGPCDIRGGIELSATHEAGLSTRLTTGGHPWGSPAAVGFATDVLQQTYGGPIGPR